MSLEWYLSLVSCFFFSLSILFCVLRTIQFLFLPPAKLPQTGCTSPAQSVSTREYVARNNKLQRHLAVSLKQQSAKKETIPKLQQRYEGFRNNNDTDMLKRCSEACRHGSHKPLVAVATIMGMKTAEFIKTAELRGQNGSCEITVFFWVLAQSSLETVFRGRQDACLWLPGSVLFAFIFCRNATD